MFLLGVAFKYDSRKVHNLVLLSAGITLALFGGAQKHSMDQNKVPVRGDIHVIIVGMLKSFL